MIDLQRILKIVNQTGGSYVFANDLGDEFVLMPLKNLQNIITGNSQFTNISKEELLETINREIALWKAEEDENISQYWLNAEGVSELDKELDDDLYYFEIEGDKYLD